MTQTGVAGSVAGSSKALALGISNATLSTSNATTATIGDDLLVIGRGFNPAYPTDISATNANGDLLTRSVQGVSVSAVSIQQLSEASTTLSGGKSGVAGAATVAVIGRDDAPETTRASIGLSRVNVEPTFGSSALLNSTTLDLGYAHGFITGTPLVYEPGTGTAMSGLSPNNTYFAIFDNNNPTRLKLANSEANALKGIALNLAISNTTGTDQWFWVASPGQGVNVSAQSATRLTNVGGAVGLSAEALAIGAGAEALSLNKKTEAWIADGTSGNHAQVNAQADVGVTAESWEKFVGFTGTAGLGTSLSIAGAVGLNLSKIVTEAHLGDWSVVTAQGNVQVLAADDNRSTLLSGTLAVGSVAVGPSVAFEVITKSVQAWIGQSAQVTALGNGAPLSTATGASSVAYAPPTFNAATAVDTNNSTIQLGLNPGLATGDAVLYSAGTGGVAIGGLVSGWTYFAIVDPSQDGLIQLADSAADASAGVHIQFTTTGSGTGQSVVPQAQVAPQVSNSDLSTDAPGLTQQAVVTPETMTLNGLAVTATSTDTLYRWSVSGAVADLSIPISATFSQLDVDTAAYIDTGAQINSSNTGAGSSQSVLVAAGSTVFQVGVAGAVGVGAAAAVGGGSDASLISLNTLAHIDSGAVVHAAADVVVQATASENVTSLSVGVAVANNVAVLGAVSALTIDNTTVASIGEGSAATTVIAGNNVLVAANDETTVTVAAGAAAVAIEVGGGVGVSVPVVVIHKQTQAYVDDNASVNGLANGPSTDVMSVVNGTVNQQFSGSARQNARGVAIQAFSLENVNTYSFAGAGGLVVGVGGAVSVTDIHSTTQAWSSGTLGGSLGGTPGASQAINLGAANSTTVDGVVVGIAAGFVGLGGAVNVVQVTNTTQAWIDANSTALAVGDVSVLALSYKDFDSTSGSGSLGGNAINGSVTVIQLGAALTADARSALTNSQGTTTSDSLSQTNAAGTSSSISSVGGYSSDGQPTTAPSGATSSYSGNAGMMSSLSVQAQTSGATSSSASSAGSQQAATDLDATIVSQSVAAWIGNAAVVTAEDIVVAANEAVTAIATAGGAALGVFALGAAVSIVTINSNTVASVEEEARVTARGNLSVAANLVRDTVSASAYEGVGSLLISLGAQVAEITDNSTQTVTVGSNAALSAGGTLSVTSDASRNLNSLAGGIDLSVGVGSIAAGVSTVLVTASGGAATTVQSGASLSGQALSVSAETTDSLNTDGWCVAAGFVGGAATVSQINDHAATTVSLGNAAQLTATGSLGVSLSATQSVTYSANVDNGACGVVSGSGASITNTFSPVVSVAVGNDVSVVAPQIAIAASGNVNTGSDGVKVIVGSGGAVAVAAGTQETSLSLDTTVTIDGGAQLHASNPTGSTTPQQTFGLNVSATNSVAASNFAKMVGAGICGGADVTSAYNASNFIAGITLGDSSGGASLDSDGSLALATRNSASIEDIADADAYAFLGWATASSKINLTPQATVTVAANSQVTATGTLAITAGRDLNGLADSFNLETQANPISYSVIGIDSDPVSQVTLTQSDLVLIEYTASVRGASDVNLVADKGAVTLSGICTAVSGSESNNAQDPAGGTPSSASPIGEQSSDQANLPVIVVTGNSVYTPNSGIGVYGTVQAAYESSFNLTINAPLTAVPAGATPPSPYYYASSDGTFETWFPSFTYSASIPDFELQFSVVDLNSTLTSQINALNALYQQALYTNNPQAAAGYQAQINQLNYSLAQLNSENTYWPQNDIPAGVIQVPDVTAGLGNINLTSDYLVGSGSLLNPGNAFITITNNSVYFLELSDLVIPNYSGGLINFNGLSVTSSAQVTSANINTPATLSASFASFETGADQTEPPGIQVSNTFNSLVAPSSSYGGLAPSAFIPPSIIFNGDVTVRGGAFTASNPAGGIWVTQNADISAGTVNISAGASVDINSAGLFHTGGDPRQQWYQQSLVNETAAAPGSNPALVSLIANPVATESSTNSNTTLVAAPFSLTNSTFTTPTLSSSARWYSNPSDTSWSFNNAITSSNYTQINTANTSGAGIYLPSSATGWTSSQLGWLQGLGSMSQTVQATQAGSYVLQFQAAQYNTSQAQTIAVFVDGQPVGLLTPTNSSGSPAVYASPAFTLSAGLHTFTLAGTARSSNGGSGSLSAQGNGYATALIDDVKIMYSTQGSRSLVIGSSAPSSTAVPVSDPGFESPTIGAGTASNAVVMAPVTGSPWSFASAANGLGGVAGLSGNYSNITIPSSPTAPQGQQVAFLEGNGGTITQSLNFASAGTYSATFQGLQTVGQVQNAIQFNSSNWTLNQPKYKVRHPNQWVKSWGKEGG